MSQNHLHDVIHSQRSSLEYARLLETLDDRNQQLQKAESAANDYRHMMRWALGAAVFFLVLLSIGGNA